MLTIEVSHSLTLEPMGKRFMSVLNASISYRVFLKKVSFGISKFILVSKEEKNLDIESKYKVRSPSKFS